jgi:DNA-binding MarR family transcriptional regulator
MKDDLPTPATKPLELGEFLCFAVYSASHAFNRVYQPLLKELKLTYPQFIALILLWEADGQTVGALGRKLSLQSNTLTPMLKRLEGLGYVKRVRSLGDERQVRIHLTETGRRLHGQASDIVRSVRVATELEDGRMEDLTKGVNDVRRSLEKHSTE